MVVASSGDVDESHECADALAAELTSADQIVWVGPRPAPRGIGTLVVADKRARGELYRAGLDAADNRWVAFTDTSTVVLPGWRQAAVARLAAGAAVVGGPVVPRSTTPARNFAGFVVEYGPHATPPYSSATGDVSANNVAYDRGALEDVLEADEPVWKSVVDARLAAAGHPPVVEPAMRVLSTKRYRWGDLLAERARHGRLYGAQRATAISAPARAARVLATAALPPLAYARLARRLVADQALRRPFVTASPMVVVALSAWSYGEAVGLATARGPGRDVF